jgi:excisionase family DNA binding protein
MKEDKMNWGEITPSEISAIKEKLIYDLSLINAAAVCKLLGCSLSTINRMVDDGDLTVYQRYPDRPGSPRMFLLKDVDRYIKSIKIINNYE